MSKNTLRFTMGLFMHVIVVLRFKVVSHDK